MQCIQCEHENRAGRRFCAECGAPLDLSCLSCAFMNEPGDKFCGGCGIPLVGPTSVPVSPTQHGVEVEGRFQTLLLAVMQLLQRERRITYRTLKYLLGVNDMLLTEIGEELRLRRLAIDEEGKVLVWTGESQSTPLTAAVAPNQPDTLETTNVSPAALPSPPPLVTSTTTEANGSTASPEVSSIDVSPDEPAVVLEPARSAPEAERRQLTVMFCDLVGSTDLSGTLDPENLREVIRAYQETAAEVIERYEGHIAQYLGDGLLIYFGYPLAHENDAQRAVYTGVGICEAMAALNARLEADHGVQLAVRIGMHTGPVVVGEMGRGGRHEHLATGETVNIAARLEALAHPNTAVLSPVTAQLVQRSFVLEDLGPHALKGVAEPMRLYTVVAPRTADQPDDGAITGGFAALVGRDEEIGLLLRRWDQSKDGLGQVVLLGGEAGIGKSSLVESLRDHVRQEGLTRIAFRCSPYHTNSALYPIIEHVQRALGWQPEDPADTRLVKLEHGLEGFSLPLAEAVPLLAALLSLLLPEGRYAALTLSPQQQRQQTQDVLVAWLLEEAERQAVLAVWEDLHWADPSTLETLGLLVEQAPTATMLHVLTFRPEFAPPWPPRSHLTPITLNRLERPQVEALVRRLAGGKRLPEEVVAHIVGKTDGVPLYVEELTKMLLTSDLLREDVEQYVLTGPLLSVAIPDTLQDSLMARLDQMNTAKEVAQLGSVLGREFAYDMLQALSGQDDATLQSALAQLVVAELLYQRGRPPRARYIFKHALIQDAAYASLLRITRQQIHKQVVQLLEVRFPDLIETQPELVAHHCTEAGQDEAAISHWQRAGQRALQRSAYMETIAHLTKGLELLKTLSDTPERIQQELMLIISLGTALMATKGYAAPEVEHIYARAQDLCQQVGDSPQLFHVLRGLWMFYLQRGNFQTARESGERLLGLAERMRDSALFLVGHRAMGSLLFYLGEFALAREHLEQGITLYDSQRHHVLAFRYGQDPGAACLAYAALVLWLLGYPDQALQRGHEALALARRLSYPFSLAWPLGAVAWLHHCRREEQLAHEQAQAAVTLSTDQGFAHFLALGMILRGWALAAKGQGEEGLAQIQQGLAAHQSNGAQLALSYYLAILAESCGKRGQNEAGLEALAEALALVEETGERFWEAELYRLKGELLLSQFLDTHAETETCFHQAFAIARQQHAKSLELRAAMSLARLWQSQGRHQEAYDLLAPVYEWFTEGFDTADLIEAKQLVDELSAKNRPPMA